MSREYSHSHIPSIPLSIPTGIPCALQSASMNTVAQRVAEAMERRGMDQSALAEAIGVTQGAISKIVVGKTANSRLLPKIAIALRVSLQWLLGKTDDASVDAVDLALSDEDRRWLDLLHSLNRRDRGAVLQLAATLAGVSEDKPNVRGEPNAELSTTLHTPKQEFRGQ